MSERTRHLWVEPTCAASMIQIFAMHVLVCARVECIEYVPLCVVVDINDP